MSKQTLSAAEQFRTLRREQSSKITGEKVVLPSGIEVVLKRVDVQPYIRAGRIPDTLLQRGIAYWEKLAELVESNPQSVSQKDSQDALAAVVFMRDVVQEAFLSPRLVVGGEGDDELDPIYLPQEDFTFVFKWATFQEKGGPAESLKKFRRK